MSPNLKSEYGESTVVHSNFQEEGPIQTTITEALDWKAGRAEYATILALTTISILTAFNSTAFSPTLSVIARDLHAGATASFWGQTAYLLPSASLQPIICSFSEVYGRKALLLMCLLFFAAGAVGPAVARNVGSFIAGRAVQGIGGAGLLSLPKVIMTDIIPLRQRPKYTALLQIASALGMMLGPVCGGALAHYIHQGWRWIFYITFPICTASFLTIWFALPLHVMDGTQYVTWISSLLLGGSLLCMLLPLSWGGILYRWSSFRTMLPLCIGAAGLACALAWARWDHSSAVLRNRSSLASYIASITQGILLSGTIYSSSLYLEGIKGYSPLITGAILLAMLGSIIPFSLAASLLMTRLGKYKPWLFIGWAVTLLGTGLLCSMDLQSSVASCVGRLIVVGAGHGILLNSLLFAVQAVVTGKDVAYATTIYTTSRTLGFALGVVIGGTLLQNFITKGLPDSDVAARIADNVTRYVAALQTNSSLPVQREIVEEALIYGFRWVFIVLTIIGGVGLVCTVAIATRSMDRPLESNHRLGTSRAQPES